MSEGELVAAILEAGKEIIQERAAAGTISQERADQILEVMEQNLYQALTRTALGPPEGMGTSGFGSGMGGRYGHWGDHAGTGYGMMGGRHHSGWGRW